MSYQKASCAALVAGVLMALSCKQGSGGRLGSVADDRPDSPTTAGMIRALRGQLDFDLGSPSTTPAVVPGPQTAPMASGAPQGQPAGGPIRVTLGSGSGQGAGTVRMEFAVIFHDALSQLSDLENLSGGAEFVRVGSLSTSNIIHEPQNLRVIAEELGRAVYYVRSPECTTANRCVRLMTGGETLKASKEKTLLLEFRQTGDGVWVVSGFRYFGHATVTEYGMPIQLILTDALDG